MIIKTTKGKGNNKLWVPGVGAIRFKDGQMETTDERIIAAARASGRYEIDGVKEKRLEDMSGAELKEYAAERDIDLTGTKSKAEALERILEAEA